MKADEFADRLARLGPQLDKLDNKTLRQSFECRRRLSPLAEADHQDELLVLLAKWDCSSVGVGMVAFLDSPKNSASGIQVGVVEADPLILLSDGEVTVEEYGFPGHLLWKAASNGDKLLDALIIAAEFFVKRVLKKIRFEDLEAAKSAAHHCALAAGGNEYGEFYLMLLGAE